MNVLECRLKEFLQEHPEILKKGSRYCVKNSQTTVKLPSIFTPQLCRLLGVIHGDGNMSYGRILITDKDEGFHERGLRKLFLDVFGIRPNVFEDKNRNSFYSHFKNKVVYTFLTEVLEVPKGSVRKKLTLPSFMQTLNDGLKASYLSGLFDSEGHVGKGQLKINLATTSRPLFEFAKEFLERKGIKLSIYIRKRRKNPEYEIYIYGRENIRVFLEHISFSHPAKLARLRSYPRPLKTRLVPAVNAAD